MSGGIGDTTEIVSEEESDASDNGEQKIDTSEDEGDSTDGGDSQTDNGNALRAVQRQPQGTVLVEGSREVFVGPRLVYNGPVTVNQIVRVSGRNGGLDHLTGDGLVRQAITASLNRTDSSAGNTQVNLVNCDAGADHNNVLLGIPNDTSAHQQTRIPAALSKNPTILKFLWILMGIIAFSSVCVAIAFAVQRPQYAESVPVSSPSPTDKLKDLSEKEPYKSEPLPLFEGHYIYSKHDWGGLAAYSKQPLLHPTPVVIVSHTVSAGCHSCSQCSDILKNIQSYHMNQSGARTGDRIVDIGYNFLIGGDGNVYEGRGWDVTSFHRNSKGVLGISFIGNFEKYDLTSEQITAALKLLELGVELKKLAPDYIMIAHSQTFDTQSPGKNVVKVVEKWPHWTPEYKVP